MPIIQNLKTKAHYPEYIVLPQIEINLFSISYLLFYIKTLILYLIKNLGTLFCNYFCFYVNFIFILLLIIYNSFYSELFKPSKYLGSIKKESGTCHIKNQQCQLSTNKFHAKYTKILFSITFIDLLNTNLLNWPRYLLTLAYAI